MSNLKEALKTGKFPVTSEIGPPKGTNVEHELEAAVSVKDKVTAVNVTDLQSAVMRVGSLAVCRLLKERGVEPVLQVTCRDRNRISLQSELLSAAVLGVENVLCLTGDHIVLGDHRQARPVFDLDSVQLLKAVSELNSGHDMAGHELDGTPDLFPGAVVTPEFDPVDLQLIKMKKKIAAGAKFFQTQAVFDADKFKTFMDKVSGWNVPVMAGLVLLKSPGMAKFMNENVAGVFVPDSLIEEVKSTAKEDRKKKAAEIAARTIREVRDCCQGVHIMPLGWDDVVPEIIQQAELN
jgi:5,10-methylenetetrahydrofolate reductase